MKHIPILFSTPMVQAILEGRKTMTRRIVKGTALDWLQPDMFTPEYVANPDNNLCPYGKVGDVLWVRETWKPKRFAGHVLDGYDYKADHVAWLEKNRQPFTKGSGCETGEVWRPSIFMPKAACRLFLEITDVRVERLQDISEEDAIAEGVLLNERGKCYLNYVDQKHMITQFIYNCRSAKDSFISLWDLINGKESRLSNPWVWVVSFKKN